MAKNFATTCAAKGEEGKALIYGHRLTSYARSRGRSFFRPGMERRQWQFFNFTVLAAQKLSLSSLVHSFVVPPMPECRREGEKERIVFVIHLSEK